MKSGVLGKRFGAAEHLVASFLWTVEDLAYNVHLEDVTLHVNLTLSGAKEKKIGRVGLIDFSYGVADGLTDEIRQSVEKFTPTQPCAHLHNCGAMWTLNIRPHVSPVHSV